MPFLRYNISMKTCKTPIQQTKQELQNKLLTLEQDNEVLRQQVEELNTRLRWFEEQLRLSRKQQFGPSSEKSELEQLDLFNEAEDTANPQLAEPSMETITYERRKRQPGQREEQFKDLPAEVIEYRLPEEEQICPCCQGALHEMGAQIREEIKYIPAQVIKLEHRQYKYACRQCEREGTSATIIKADMPRPLLPGSLASSSILAYIIDQKYTYSMPLYRQEQQFERLGINLSRQTMSNWVLKAADPWLKIVYDRLHDLLIARNHLQADETYVQVLKEPGRNAETKSCMWHYRTGREGPAILLFDYQTTRAAKHPKQFLAGFKGYLQTDGWSAYGQLPDVVLAGCWAHARRYFLDSIKALPKDEMEKPSQSKTGLEYCNRLFALERGFKKLSVPERYEERLKKSKPLLEEIHAWLKELRPKALPKSPLGKAVNYCLNQWESLTTFLKDGRLEIDNNRAERSIRSFVINRKNSLFSNTPKGAQGSAIIFSIIETAKENGLKPYKYLEYLFEQLPNVDTSNIEVIDSLLPWSEALPESCRMPNKDDSIDQE